MFDAIAGRYDLLNRVLSGGLDGRWRARAIAALNLTGRETVLADIVNYTTIVAAVDEDMLRAMRKLQVR